MTKIEKDFIRNYEKRKLDLKYLLKALTLADLLNKYKTTDTLEYIYNDLKGGVK